MKVESIDCVKKKIETIIEKSLVPEDPVHSRNTLEWLLKLKPDADEALKIAALGHDIERAVEERKVKRRNCTSYDEFKQTHALNSAKILVKIMEECNINNELVDDIFYLVQYHEIGGNKRVDVLRDADTLSFFHVNLPYYFIRNGVEETKRRFLWGYKKLPENLKRIVAEFEYQDRELELMVKKCIADSEK